MSGALVGEVLDAIESKRVQVTQAEALCLLAIAEKCHHLTRQGSVRKSRIQAAIGRSERTTERVIGALKQRGLIIVAQRGYKAHGVSRAPIYELPPLWMAEAEGSVGFPPCPLDWLPPSTVAEASGLSPNPGEVPPSWVAEAQGGEPFPEPSAKGFPSVGLPPNPNELPPKQRWASANDPPLTCDDAAYDGITYDGSIDGHIYDGAALRAGQSQNAPQAPRFTIDLSGVRTREGREVDHVQSAEAARGMSARLREIYGDQFEQNQSKDQQLSPAERLIAPYPNEFGARP